MQYNRSLTSQGRRFLVASSVVAVTGLAGAMLPSPGRAAANGAKTSEVVTANASGMLSTLSVNGPIDHRSAFFQSLGTNGRSCATCHLPEFAWSFTPESAQARFAASDGTDPLFRTNDGTNAPTCDMSTVDARRSACSMVLNKGLVRVGLAIPPNAEFSLVACDDPYGYAGPDELSLFRRPLPSTNLRFLSAVMWDGRENHAGQSILQNLGNQADDATTGHAQATSSPTRQQIDEIVRFEAGLFTAQVSDNLAGKLQSAQVSSEVVGRLHVTHTNGGPASLAQQPFFLGINDPLGQNPSGAPFQPSAFNLFLAWNGKHGKGRQPAARAAIARGEQIFNTHPIQITGVSGLNDELRKPIVMGTCTTCHDSPNVGDHSVVAPLNIGLVDASRRTPDMPLYTLQNKSTGETVQVTDPGRAMISGKWKDIGRFKGPILRGLAARAPYFHNGFAANLGEVVDFYDTRFGIGFTSQEKSDLAAFLRAL